MNRSTSRHLPLVLALALLLGWGFWVLLRTGSSPVTKVNAMPEAPRPPRPSKKELKKKLTPMQYHVTQEEGTEPPYDNAYWDNKKEGIYVDVVSGEPLFSSLDKFDSGTGWPSFTRPLMSSNIVTRMVRELPVPRTEVRSRRGDAHLGHLFKDGPAPGGLRYCINSAALRFIPKERLAAEGYERYLALFGGKETMEARNRAVATVAGGCFWGVEELFKKLPGVIETTVGYTGGSRAKATYEQVKRGDTGHAEAVQIVYDPTKVSYEAILVYFFRLHDPTTANRQGHDIGTQYRSAIFYHDEEQRKIAEQVKQRVNRSGKWKGQVVTQIVPASTFYPAEEHHQDYLAKHPGGYTCHYLRE